MSSSLIITILLFLLGLALIVKGGDWFVDAATWMAEASGLPQFLIGATVVSMATTLPEIIVSTMAAAEGSTDMAIGNIKSPLSIIHSLNPEHSLLQSEFPPTANGAGIG